MFISGYFGRDVFSFQSADAGFGASIPWGNAMVSTRWNHVVTDKMFLNVNASYTNYEFAFTSGQDDFEFGFNSGVVDWTQKAQLSWYPNLRHEIRTGWSTYSTNLCRRRSSSGRATTNSTSEKPPCRSATRVRLSWRTSWM